MFLYITHARHDRHELLSRAAAPALAAIRADAKRVRPAKIGKMLRYIEQHLFDPQLNVSNLKKACGISDNSAALVFHSQIGSPPKRYIEQHRLETAASLLAGTSLRIWEISDLIGYSSLSVFGKAFERWTGMRPSRHRRRHREPAGLPQGALVKVTEGFLDRAVTGKLPEDQALTLLTQLLDLYANP